MIYDNDDGDDDYEYYDNSILELSTIGIGWIGGHP